jgi:hypothetical protein
MEQLFEVRQATLEHGDPRIALGELAFQLCDPRVPPIRHDLSSVNERGAASSRERNHATHVQAPGGSLFSNKSVNAYARTKRRTPPARRFSSSGPSKRSGATRVS